MDEQTIISEPLAKLQDIAPAGFALGFHVIFTTPTFMFQTYRRKWLEHYAQKGFLMVDPIVHWGFENTGTIRWAELAHLDASGVLESAAKFGMKHGVSCAVEADGSRSFGGFARGDREFSNEEVATLLTTFEEIHTLTAQSKSLSPNTTAALKKLSIRYTQPDG